MKATTVEDMITAFKETDEAVAKQLEKNEETAFLAPLYRLCSEKRIALLEICHRENELEMDLSDEKMLTIIEYHFKILELVKQLSAEQVQTAFDVYNEDYPIGIAGYSNDFLDALDELLEEV